MASLLLLLIAVPSTAAGGGGGPGCSKTTNLSGFGSDLVMVQHQLCGTLNITDACSRSATSTCSPDPPPSAGGPPRPHPLQSHGSSLLYSNETLTVPLLPNVSLDQIHVWDPITASDFGHVVLPTLEPKSSDLDLSAAPSPST